MCIIYCIYYFLIIWLTDKLFIRIKFMFFHFSDVTVELPVILMSPKPAGESHVFPFDSTMKNTAVSELNMIPITCSTLCLPSIPCHRLHPAQKCKYNVSSWFVHLMRFTCGCSALTCSSFLCFINRSTLEWRPPKLRWAHLRFWNIWHLKRFLSYLDEVSNSENVPFPLPVGRRCQFLGGWSEKESHLSAYRTQNQKELNVNEEQHQVPPQGCHLTYTSSSLRELNSLNVIPALNKHKQQWSVRFVWREYLLVMCRL